MTTEDPPTTLPRQRQDHGLPLRRRLRRPAGRRQRRGATVISPLRLPAGEGHLWDNTLRACRRHPRHQRGARCGASRPTSPLLPTFWPTWISPGRCHTKFIDDTPELFDIVDSVTAPPAAAVHRQDPGGTIPRRAPSVRHPRFPKPRPSWARPQTAAGQKGPPRP